MLVVVVEVLETGPTGGERGCNAGMREEDFVSGLLPFKSGECGWSSRIFRRDSTVRKGWGLSELDDSDCDGSSSIGGGISLGSK